MNSNAGSVIYQFGSLGSPDSPAIEATFQDSGPDTVLLNITSLDTGTGGFLKDLYFNFDPTDTLKRLQFTQAGSSQGILPLILTRSNGFRADGGFYDVRLMFGRIDGPKSPTNDSIAYVISEPGLNALDFAYLDSTSQCGDSPGFSYAMAQIQGLCGENRWLTGTETLFAVPEPGFGSLLGFAFGGLWCVVRYKRRRLA